MEEQEIRLDDILNSLKKRWLMIFLLTLSAIIISTVICFYVINPKYEANTKIFIGKDESELEGYSQSDVSMYQNLLKTYSEVIKTEDLVGKSIKKSKLELETDKVLKSISVITIEDTQLIEIAYKSEEPQEAKVILENLTKEFIIISKKLIPNGNVQVIEEVKYPELPVSPNKKKSIAIAGALGLMLGIGITLLIEFLDNTYKNKEQIERELELPVLGIIPKMKEI